MLIIGTRFFHVRYPLRIKEFQDIKCPKDPVAALLATYLPNSLLEDSVVLDIKMILKIRNFKKGIGIESQRTTYAKQVNDQKTRWNSMVVIEQKLITKHFPSLF